MSNSREGLFHSVGGTKIYRGLPRDKIAESNNKTVEKKVIPQETSTQEESVYNPAPHLRTDLGPNVFQVGNTLVYEDTQQLLSNPSYLKICMFEIERSAEKAGIRPEELVLARREVKSIKNLGVRYRDDMPGSWALLYAFLENETEKEPEHIFQYLNHCTPHTQKMDLDHIIDTFCDYVGELNNEDPLFKNFNKTRLQLQNKEIVIEEEKPRLTLALARALFKAKNPSHINNEPEKVNTSRGNRLVNSLYNYSFPKALIGMIMHLFKRKDKDNNLDWKKRRLEQCGSRLFKSFDSKNRESNNQSHKQNPPHVNFRLHN